MIVSTTRSDQMLLFEFESFKQKDHKNQILAEYPIVLNVKIHFSGSINLCELRSLSTNCILTLC